MKVLVISDTHGHLSSVRHILGFAKAQKLSAVIHCGDWDNAQIVAEVKRLGVPIYAVLGNADEARFSEVWNALEGTHRGEEVLEFELDGRKIAIAHQPEKLEKQKKSHEFDALFHGHLHTKAGATLRENTLVANPGALGSTDQPSFAVYDTETNEVEIIPVT